MQMMKFMKMKSISLQLLYQLYPLSLSLSYTLIFVHDEQQKQKLA